MPKRKEVKIFRDELIRNSMPVVWVTIVLVILALGADKLSEFKKVKSIQEWEDKHPIFAVVNKVIDGNTFEIKDGEMTVRMLAIDPPARGQDGQEEATEKLSKLIEGKSVWLEYDLYQRDKYGRLLAWIWIDCEGKPEFLPYDYMRLSDNMQLSSDQDRSGLIHNPEDCQNGKLVNEEMLKDGWVRLESFQDQEKLKYQDRLRKVR